MKPISLLLSIVFLAALAGAPTAPASERVSSAIESGDVSLLRPPPLGVQLEKVASDLSFALGNTASATDAGELRPGDELVFAAVLRDGGDARQYLVRMIWRGEAERERSKTVKRHASTGHVFEYASPLGLTEVSTAGPVSSGEDRPTAVVSATVKLATEFLRMGFHDPAQFEVEQRRRRSENPGLPHLPFFTNRSNPVDQETVRRHAAVAETLSIDQTTLRMLAGRGVATDAFINILNQIPVLSDVMWEIAKKPSRFSLLLGGIKTSDRGYGEARAVDPEPWGLATDASCHSFPFILSINGDEAVRLVLLATEPSGPIRQSAGVFALLAAPVEPNGKSLLIRLVGVRRLAGPESM